MKILLLSTGRGLRPERVIELRAGLGLRASDELCLVSWQRSCAPLPVERHLVLGPHLRARRPSATDQKVCHTDLTPTNLGEVPTVSVLALTGEPPVDGQEPTIGELPGDGQEPTIGELPGDEQIPALRDAPEAGQPMWQTAAARASLIDAIAQLPVLHPQRMRQAVAWRVRRLKRHVRWLKRHVRRLKRSVSARTRIRRSLHYRKIRNRLSPASLGFAASCLWAGAVHDTTRDADLVIALDAASHRGAWTLAKRVPGPDVVIGVTAGKQLLEERRQLPKV